MYTGFLDIKEIAGNELADQQAKAGAQEMLAAQDHGPIAMDKREAITEIKQKIGGKMEIEVPIVRKDRENTRNFLRSWEKGLLCRI